MTSLLSGGWIVYNFVGSIDLKIVFEVTLAPQKIFTSLNPRKLIKFAGEFSHSLNLLIIEMSSKIQAPPV